MRHQKANKKFNRNFNQRKALFRSLLFSLFLKEEIHTTLEKAKLLKKIADKLISKAKEGSLSVRRQILAFLPNKNIVDKLVNEIAPRFTNLEGGYTRLIRIGRRKGDNAMMAKIELLKKKNKKNKEVDNSKKVNK